jgi:molybdopterin-synthase adenylyltransferase
MTNGARITLLGSQHQALIDYLESHSEGHEKAAIVLFRRLHLPIDGLESSDRYIAQKVIPFENPWVTDSSPTHISFNLEPFRELFRKCEEEGLVFGFIHNHPTGLEAFSQIDDENERTIFTAIRNRNGNDITFVSMVWANGKWLARTRSGADPDTALPVRHTLVISDRLNIYGYKESNDEHAEVQARQAAAFGKPFVDMLQSLRVGIVGCGGTGSPLATLLARAGIGELVLIDEDKLERSNLNRVRGLTTRDVDEVKAIRLKEFIENIGISIKVSAFKALIDTNPEALDSLASCDIIFGCTDDFAGREVMNAALYVYAQLLIDVGLGGKISDDHDGQPTLRYHFGRISTIMPESGQCLFCQGVIRDIWIRTQLERRENPNITEEELKEKYLEDGETDAPGVGPFTNASADFAVATLFDLIKPYRRFPLELRKDLFIVDFVKMEIGSHQTNGEPSCQYCCEKHFLLLKEGNRLNRPILGKRNEYT